MIHTLDTKAADYIPELGDLRKAAREAKNAQGLQVADYYADADGEAFITSHIK